MNTAQATIEFIKASSAVVGKSRAKLAEIEKLRTKAAEMVPVLVDKLVDAHLIDPAMRKEAEDALNTHHTTLSLVGQMIEKIAELNTRVKQAGDGGLGRPRDETATPEPKKSLIIGARSSEKRASDQIFSDVLNGRV